MRILTALLCILTITPSFAQTTREEIEAWDRANPTFPFYSGGIVKDCATCDTYVVIAATVRPSQPLIKAFQKVATLGGRKHQGALLDRRQLLGSINELTRLGCSAPGSDLNIAYYISKVPNQCVAIPYESEAQLIPVIERIYAFLNDGDRVARELSGLAQEESEKKLAREVLSAAGQSLPWLPGLARALVNSFRTTARSTDMQQGTAR